MVKLTKKNVDTVSKILEELPKELQEIVILKTFDKLAIKCYEDPEYLNICSKDKEKISKQILMEAEYKDIENWVGKYDYLVKHLLNIVKIISKLDGSNIKLENKTKITNYINGPKIFEIDEEQYNKIPIDVINFILKNRNRILYDEKIIEKIYKYVDDSKINEVEKILIKYYVPQEIKNDLAKKAIEKYNREPHSGTAMDIINNKNINMVEYLAQFGANKYLIKSEFKKFGNTTFENIYN